MKKIIENYKKVVGKRTDEINKDLLINGIVINGIVDDEMLALFPKHLKELKTVFGVLTDEEVEEIYGIMYTGKDAKSISTSEVLNKRAIELNEVKYDVLTVKEMGQFILDELSVDKALDSEIVAEMVDFIINNKISVSLENISVREAQIALATILFKNSRNSSLKNADFGVHFMGYIATKEPLFIKNDKYLELVKNSSLTDEEIRLIKVILDQNIGVLAENFNRHKKFYLALKMANKKEFGRSVNKISKLSKKNHVAWVEPKSKTLVNRLLNDEVMFDELSEYSFETLVLAYNTLSNSLQEYRFFLIRNGLLHVEKNKREFSMEDIAAAMDMVKQSIVERDIVIPVSKDNTFNIGVPTSRKQYLAGIPYGTELMLEKGDNVGIYWHNDGGAYDIDLSLIDVQGYRYSWNSSRGEKLKYSGDVTNASNGANEFFTVQDLDFKDSILDANIFSGKSGSKVSYTIERDGKMLFQSGDFEMSKHEMMLGLFSDGKFKFFKAGTDNKYVSECDLNVLKSQEKSLTFNELHDWKLAEGIEIKTKEFDSLSDLSIDEIEACITNKKEDE